MTNYGRKFALEILTPDGPVLATEAVSLVLPAADGQIGILGGHAPLLAMIGAGKLSLEDQTGNRREFFISGGFVNVRENAVSVLPEQCQNLGEIRPETARSELDQAQQMPSDTVESKALRRDAIFVARAKVRAVRP
jgi:F-type H+-transporting ATPase subunit epsilon